MADFFFRTEDIKPDDVLDYFVETQIDREVVDTLKNANPTILIGSRGVGKSFLLRVAQQELLKSFDESRVFPVYVSFVRSSLLQTNDHQQFANWMLAKICSSIIRALSSNGIIARSNTSTSSLLTGEEYNSLKPETKIETVAENYESSWRTPGTSVDATPLPSIDDFRDAIEDLCAELKIKRISLFIDEAAHIFLPDQQRQFFTLFRDLRHHCLTCNAAVYPGVTSFGDTFQPIHDATFINIDRNVQSEDYVRNMREIVEKQADSALLTAISENGKNFSTLAYAATGNPRILLKTLARAPKVNGSQVNEVIREYYRTDIWAEHSLLSTKYSGHKEIIDWGRSYVETNLLPAMKAKNDKNIDLEKKTSAYLWLHRDAPEAVKEAFRILTYTGVMIEISVGIKATKSEIGTRYLVNLGCLLALESSPVTNGFEICKSLDIQRMTELGSSSPAFKALVDYSANMDSHITLSLDEQLNKNIIVLDLTSWQHSKLFELGLVTVRDVLNATEKQLKTANYVGDVRARRMRNAAVAAVLEYLSG
jgi:hypothetical protein